MTSTNGAKRAVIYTRLSKDRSKGTEGEGVKVEDQERQCRELAARRGLTVTAVYSDNDMTAVISSKRFKPRPDYAAMLDALKSGEADAVLAWHTDRLHRDLTELDEYIKACGGDSGIPTYTVRDGDLDLATSGGRMVARIKGAVALQMVEHMTEQVKSGKTRIRKAGRWPGGRVPYGYRVEGEFAKGTGRVLIDKTEAEFIRGMCRDVIAGKNLHEIAHGLVAAGAPRPGKPLPGERIGRRDRTWDPGQVRGMVTNPRYAALMSFQGEITGEGDWPAIISRDIRDKVLAALDSRPGNRKGQPGPRPTWLGSGIYRCGKCSSQNMRVNLLANGRRGYQCRDCHGVSRDAGRTDAMVEDTVKLMLRHPAFATALRPSTDLAGLNDRRDEISRELEEWAAMRMTPRAYREAAEPLWDELDRIEAKLTEAYRGAGLGDIAGVPDPAAKWDAPPPQGYTMAQKRAILRALVEVTILPIKNTDGGPRMMGPEEGWKVGDPWFRPESVRIRPRQPGTGAAAG
jgi:site-specific DNA recombinase